MKPFKKAVSAMVIASFVAMDLAWAAPIEAAATVSSQQPLQQVLRDPATFQVPSDFVLLQEIHKGSDGTLIIHIQDAHVNLSGQQNMAGALDEIMAKYDISLVLVEGGTKEDTLTPLKRIAPPEVWKKVAKKFLMEGRIAGEEYLNLTSDHDMRIIGIEDKDLYMKSLHAYADLTEKRPDILETLKLIQRTAIKLKNRIYPEELNDYEKIANDSRQEASQFERSLKELMSLAERSRPDLFSEGRYPALQEFLIIQKREKEIAFDLANLEQGILIEEISQKGGGDDLKTHLDRMSKLKNQKLSQYAYFQNTLNIAEGKGIDLSKYQNLLKYGEYLEAFSKVDLEQVLDEMERLEDEVYKSLLTTQDQKLLRSIDRYLKLLWTAYNIQMSTKDFNLFKANEPDFSTIAYLAFLNRKLTELGYFEDLIPYTNLLEEGKTSLEAFYDSVTKRDFAFIENTQRILKEENQKVAVLISGGYHTPHLKKLLKSKGYSYAVLTPLVTSETNQEKYERLLLEPINKEIRRVDSVNGRIGTKSSDIVPLKTGERSENATRLVEEAIRFLPEPARAGARLAAATAVLELVRPSVTEGADEATEDIPMALPIENISGGIRPIGKEEMAAIRKAGLWPRSASLQDDTIYALSNDSQAFSRVDYGSGDTPVAVMIASQGPKGPTITYLNVTSEDQARRLLDDLAVQFGGEASLYGEIAFEGSTEDRAEAERMLSLYKALGFEVINEGVSSGTLTVGKVWAYEIPMAEEIQVTAPLTDLSKMIDPRFKTAFAQFNNGKDPEIIDLSGLTESQLQSAKEDLARRDPGEIVILTYSGIDAGFDRGGTKLDSRMVVDRAGKLLERFDDFAGGKASLEAHELVLDFSVYPEKNHIRLHTFSIGNEPEMKEYFRKRGVVRFRDFLRSFISNLEKNYAGMKVSTLAWELATMDESDAMVPNFMKSYFGAEPATPEQLEKMKEFISIDEIFDVSFGYVGAVGNRGLAKKEVNLETAPTTITGARLAQMNRRQFLTMAGTVAAGTAIVGGGVLALSEMAKTLDQQNALFERRPYMMRYEQFLDALTDADGSVHLRWAPNIDDKFAQGSDRGTHSYGIYHFADDIVWMKGEAPVQAQIDPKTFEANVLSYVSHEAYHRLSWKYLSKDLEGRSQEERLGRVNILEFEELSLLMDALGKDGAGDILREMANGMNKLEAMSALTARFGGYGLGDFAPEIFARIAGFAEAPPANEPLIEDAAGAELEVGTGINRRMDRAVERIIWLINQGKLPETRKVLDDYFKRIKHPSGGQFGKIDIKDRSSGARLADMPGGPPNLRLQRDRSSSMHTYADREKIPGLIVKIPVDPDVVKVSDKVSEAAIKYGGERRVGERSVRLFAKTWIFDGKSPERTFKYLRAGNRSQDTAIVQEKLTSFIDTISEAARNNDQAKIAELIDQYIEFRNEMWRRGLNDHDLSIYDIGVDAQGRVVGWDTDTVQTVPLTEAELAEKMVGRETVYQGLENYHARVSRDIAEMVDFDAVILSPEMEGMTLEGKSVEDYYKEKALQTYFDAGQKYANGALKLKLVDLLPKSAVERESAAVAIDQTSPSYKEIQDLFDPDNPAYGQTAGARLATPSRPDLQKLPGFFRDRVTDADLFALGQKVDEDAHEEAFTVPGQDKLLVRTPKVSFGRRSEALDYLLQRDRVVASYLFTIDTLGEKALPFEKVVVAQDPAKAGSFKLYIVESTWIPVESPAPEVSNFGEVVEAVDLSVLPEGAIITYKMKNYGGGNFGYTLRKGAGEDVTVWLTAASGKGGLRGSINMIQSYSFKGEEMSVDYGVLREGVTVSMPYFKYDATDPKPLPLIIDDDANFSDTPKDIVVYLPSEGARLAAGEEAPAEKFLKSYSVSLKDLMTDPVKGADENSVFLLARAFAANPRATIKPAPFQFDAGNAIVRMQKASDGRVFLSFYDPKRMNEGMKESEISRIELKADVLAKAKAANKVQPAVSKVEAIEAAKPVLAALSELSKANRQAENLYNKFIEAPLANVDQTRKVVQTIVVEDRAAWEANGTLDLVRAQVSRFKDILKSDKNVRFRFVDKTGSTVYDDLSDDITVFGDTYESIYIGVASDAILSQAAGKAGFLSVEDFAGKSEQGVIPYLATFAAATMVARSDRLNDKVGQMLRTLIERETIVGIDESKFSAMKKVEKVDTNFYRSLAIKAVARLNLDQILEFTKMAMKAIGAAA